MLRIGLLDTLEALRPLVVALEQLDYLWGGHLPYPGPVFPHRQQLITQLLQSGRFHNKSTNLHNIAHTINKTVKDPNPWKDAQSNSGISTVDNPILLLYFTLKQLQIMKQREQELQQKRAKQKADLLREIEALKLQEMPVAEKPQKILEIEKQIEQYRQRIKEQEKQLEQEFPKVNPKLLTKLQEVKKTYAKVAKERLQLVKNHTIDKYDSWYLKEFDKLDYIKKAYFPLFNDKQSALLGFSEQCVFHDEFEEYLKYVGENEKLEDDIKALERQIQQIERNQ